MTSIPASVGVIDLCRIAYQDCFRYDLKKCSALQGEYFGCSNVSLRCSNATRLAFVTCTLALTDARLLPTLAVSVGISSALGIDQLAAALLANFSRPGCEDLTVHEPVLVL